MRQSRHRLRSPNIALGMAAQTHEKSLKTSANWPPHATTGIKPFDVGGHTRYRRTLIAG